MTVNQHGGPRLTWPTVLSGLVRGEDQSSDATAWAMGQILAGEATPVQMAAFVVALRAKGETVEEIVGLAEMMLSYASPITVEGRAVDVVGSGGDRANTVNISTMAAIVAAGAGALVVKHGNRAASSACGTADVLEQLGVVLDLPPARQQQVIQSAGIGFLFAPHYHPGLRHASVARRELGIPTTFNFLGPLTNPGRPNAQAVGVADPRMAELMAGVFARRGNQGMVFHGADGLDELTTTTTSSIWLFRDGQVRRSEFDPTLLGLPRARVEDLVGGDPATNAEVVRELLAGKAGPVRDIVTLNAAAALLAFNGPDLDADLVGQFADQLVAAEESLTSGAAGAKLQQWVAATRQAAG
ncbi:anthranilate phosphoribosyltransferase [Microlunatus panaciterrae]|uniref:Anthranilate phosphoribosyltransferase n=1 Tax=Microlunatus panaciterrae TaxID=400768 RepID=A0ABS2RNT3_9ACTN|nr:anthranilate phosphoribosyltransferase [Microlunatus panaciterrae]MBM7800137.1 anthranilate phosphoribosyltransferase [Microlunatus panaciterrae]